MIAAVFLTTCFVFLSLCFLSCLSGGQSWVSYPIHEPALMLLSVTTIADKNITLNQYDPVINGLGLLSGGTQFLCPSGQMFMNSSEEKVSMAQSQDVEAVNGVPGAVVITGQFNFFKDNNTYNMIGLSKNNGASFEFINTGGDPDVPNRYGSFPSANVGFVAAGTCQFYHETFNFNYSHA